MNKRIGEINVNNHGSTMKIVEYNSYNDIIVEFQDDYRERVHTTIGNFKNGNVRNHYERSVYGIGYLGVGRFAVKDGQEKTHHYRIWHELIARCYADTKKDEFSAYYDICTVCDEWLCYQNFAEWFENNKYECEGRLHLDKDILYPGNKVYSPETCLLVPQRINMIFTNKTNSRGLPNGIIQAENGYLAKYNHKELGVYKTVEQAYKVYAEEKEKNIKQVADEYKDMIPSHVYEALYRYKVDIKNDKNYMAA